MSSPTVTAAVRRVRRFDGLHALRHKRLYSYSTGPGAGAVRRAGVYVR